MNEQVVALLKDARALITQGWTQGTFRVRDVHGCRYCAVGAFLFAGPPSFDAVVYAAERILQEAARTHVGSVTNISVNPITQFNDTPGRTQAEVLALYDRAIELATAGAAMAPA